MPQHAVPSELSPANLHDHSFEPGDLLPRALHFCHPTFASHLPKHLQCLPLLPEPLALKPLHSTMHHHLCTLLLSVSPAVPLAMLTLGKGQALNITEATSLLPDLDPGGDAPPPHIAAPASPPPPATLVHMHPLPDHDVPRPLPAGTAVLTALPVPTGTTTSNLQTFHTLTKPLSMVVEPQLPLLQ